MTACTVKIWLYWLGWNNDGDGDGDDVTVVSSILLLLQNDN
jgi:hypothetical protein